VGLSREKFVGRIHWSDRDTACERKNHTLQPAL
jgi:hypothetical protein